MDYIRSNISYIHVSIQPNVLGSQHSFCSQLTKIMNKANSDGEENLAFFLHPEGTPFLWELGEEKGLQEKIRALTWQVLHSI